MVDVSTGGCWSVMTGDPSSSSSNPQNMSLRQRQPWIWVQGADGQFGQPLLPQEEQETQRRRHDATTDNRRGRRRLRPREIAVIVACTIIVVLVAILTRSRTINNDSFQHFTVLSSEQHHDTFVQRHQHKESVLVYYYHSKIRSTQRPQVWKAWQEFAVKYVDEENPKIALAVYDCGKGDFTSLVEEVCEVAKDLATPYVQWYKQKNRRKIPLKTSTTVHDFFALVKEDLLNNDPYAITSSTHHANVLQSHKRVWVAYMNPSWSTYCQRLVPRWRELRQQVDRLHHYPVQLVTVDCTAQAALCREVRIRSFPTLRWYQDGDPITPDYKLDRSVPSLVAYLERRLLTERNAPMTLRTETFRPFVQKHPRVMVAYVLNETDTSIQRERKSSTSAWKALIHAVRTRNDLPVALATVDCHTSPSLCQEKDAPGDTAFPLFRYYSRASSSSSSPVAYRAAPRDDEDDLPAFITSHVKHEHAWPVRVPHDDDADAADPVAQDGADNDVDDEWFEWQEEEKEEEEEEKKKRDDVSGIVAT